MTIYSFNESIFIFYDQFAKDDNIFAIRWLKKYDHEMSEYKSLNNNLISVNLYLKNFFMLFIEKTVIWLKLYLKTTRLLTEIVSDQNTVTYFRVLLCERFSSNAVEIISVFFNVELTELKQRENKLLSSYYKRVINFMQRIEVKNKNDSAISLFMLKSIMLNTILRVFIKDITDQKIQKKIIKDMTSVVKFFKLIYQLTKKVRRINLKIQKLFEVKIK